MTIELFRGEPGDLGAPRHRLDSVLLLGRFGQDIVSGQGIRMQVQGVLRIARRTIVVMLFQEVGGALQKPAFLPTLIEFGTVGDADNRDNESKCDGRNNQGQVFGRNTMAKNVE